MKTESREEKGLYNSFVLDAYVKLINKKYPFIDVEDLMSSAGLKDYQLGDHSVWFTQQQVNRFHQRLSELTDNLKISRES